MANSNELRVFISSTFRDLQEEREHLIKKIFPEIRALCRERGITFTEVDLRWGLTDEDVALGQVIRACLEEVDRCRPYFIGITGSRYGYVPSFLDIQKDPALLEQYPWIEDAAMEGMSITEMEAEFGVFSPPAEVERTTSRAFFYFRRHRESFDDDAEDEEAKRLAQYQRRIEATDAVVEKFRDPVSLGEMVYDDLVRIVKRDFADAKPPTPLEVERSRHEAFSLSRRRAYIANPVYLKRLNDHVASDDPPLVVYAESGSGKSSLFAYWAESYRKKHPETHVIEHYVGIGATSTDHYGVIQHLCMEIRERFGREEEIPSDPKAMETAFGQWLGYADHALKKSSERMVVILDGLNQLQGTALKLRWIPDVISPSIRLILSSTVEGTLVELKKRGWGQFGMQALSGAEREAVIVRYLAEYRKALNTEQINRVATDYKCGHPLFLKTLLEELRLVSRHEDLAQRIAEYLGATGTEDLFQKVLERIEEDHGARAVRETLSALWCSRSGLDERELSEITGASRLKITAMVAGLDYHLVRKEGYLTFFHDYLRRAVEKRYLGDDETRHRTHLRLAEFFESAELTRRSAGERIWQCAQAEEDEKLIATLADPAVLHRAYRKTGVEDVLTAWSRLRDAGHDPEAIYLESIEEDNEDVSLEWLQLWATVATVLERLSLWVGAAKISQRLRVAASEGRFMAEEASAEQRLGWLSYFCGNHAEAIEQLDHALHLYEELGDRRGVANVVGIMGIVYASRREYDRALESYQRGLTIAEELGDRQGISLAVGYIGTVYSARREYDRALDSYQRQLTMEEELGHRAGISIAVGNMGTVYANRGDYDRALESYQRQWKIDEELGDKNGISRAVGNMGVVYTYRGEYDRALDAFGQAITGHRSIGARPAFAYWLVALGRALLELADSHDSMPEFLPKYLPDVSQGTWRVETLRAARHQAEEGVEILREIPDWDTLFDGRVLLARIEAAENRRDEAVEALRDLLQEAGSDSERAETRYWLWKLGVDEQAATVLALYKSLYAKTPKHTYRARLDELMGSGQSS